MGFSSFSGIGLFCSRHRKRGAPGAGQHRGRDGPRAGSTPGTEGPPLFGYDRAPGTRDSLASQTPRGPSYTGNAGPLPSLSRMCHHSGYLVRRHQRCLPSETRTASRSYTVTGGVGLRCSAWSLFALPLGWACVGERVSLCPGKQQQGRLLFQLIPKLLSVLPAEAGNPERTRGST